MKLIDIIESFDTTNINPAEKKTRRETLSMFGEITKKMAIATVPGALLAALPNISKAAGNGPETVVDVLKFALTLEYLESSFYNQGINSGVIANADNPVFNIIASHETAHVSLLQATITQLGGSYAQAPTFDFTANGAFSPFTIYADFLALSQAFEDTGVRAYKGQAGNLLSSDSTTRGILQVALQIHSVEARHAAEVRRIRGGKGWITGSSRGSLPAATQAIYDGEEVSSQGSPAVNIAAIMGVGSDAATEAFDEPLTQQQVTAIVTPFL